MAIVPTVILSVPGQKELFLVNVEYAAFDCRGSLYGEQRAADLGANAVVGVDIDYEVLGAGNGMLMVTASGTAVVAE